MATEKAPTTCEALKTLDKEQTTTESSAHTWKAGQTFTDMTVPEGLAITREGHLIVADWGNHCITIIDPTNGKKIRSFGQFRSELSGQFKSPCGVAVTQDGRIIVTDFWNHNLHVLTAEGALITTVGSEGSQPLQFHGPTGIAVDRNGKVFVTEAFKNNRVQVLNADLTYSHCFGSKGDQPGQLHDPKGITFDADGMVYVADRSNYRVQKFTPEGKLLGVINCKKGGGMFHGPWGVCFDGDGILYVTEWGNNTVSMFTSEGRFLGYIGDSDGSSFEELRYIISDQKGRLYMSDKQTVVTYEQQ